MKLLLKIIFLVLYIKETSLKITSTTLAPKERIQILREEIKQDILEIRSTKNLYPLGVTDPLDDYEYEQNEKLPITPIMETDEKKIKDKFKLRTLKNKPPIDSKNATDDKQIENGANISTTDAVLGLRSKKRLRIKKKLKTRKPLQIFYRRIYDIDMLVDKEWVHCQDMIGPLLSGAKVNISSPKRLSSRDPTVLRFIQLLNVNTTAYSRDDIYSILYQISNLQLRLFQWDVVPLNILLNVIIKEKKHTFINLKHGIQELFHNWRLDISNTSTLLKQARIFRPPCVQVSSFDGSTKSPRLTKYPKKGQTETTPCDDNDDCNY